MTRDKRSALSANARQRGSHWEQVAESFLNGRGITTLERNYRVRCGEIDLVMRDGNTLVFTEVRYRGNDSHGSGAESVTPAKQRRVISAAHRFLQSHPSERVRPCRFDVISIGSRDGRTLLNWIRNAFDAG
jgi:putative endonuclease